MKKKEFKKCDARETVFYPEEIEFELFKIYSALQKSFGCNYMSLIYEHINTGEKFVFQTNPDWGKVYVGEKFMLDCPLLTAGKKLMHEHAQKDVMFTWDSMIPKNKKQKMVMDARKDFGIFHGLSASKEYGAIRQMFGMATEEKNPHFLSYVLNETQAFTSLIYTARHITNNFIFNKMKWRT